MNAGATDRRPLGTPRVIALVARRELRERLRAKSFWILGALLVIVVLGIGVGARLMGGEPSTIKVALSGPEVTPMSSALAATAAGSDRHVKVSRYDSATAARRSLVDGDAAVAVDTARKAALFDGAPDQDVLALVQQAWATVAVIDNLNHEGLTTEAASRALRTEPLRTVRVDRHDETSLLGVLTGTVAAVLLFLSLQMFGGYVLSGVVEEKATGVVELLLSRIRPDQLLGGKVLGIGGAALIQFTAAVAATLAALAISGRTIPAEIWSAVPMTLVWFLAGYAFYSLLFALAGSLVSRQEDAQAASAPIMTALGGSYMLVFVLGYIPGSTASRILSLLPPVAPTLMPMRMAAGSASAVEVVVALVLLALSILGVWKLTGRVYGAVVLRRGERITWGTVWSVVRGRTA